MIRYAATASDGSRSRAEDREAIDRWAARKCAEGCEVTVWARNVDPSAGALVPQRVGLWRPLCEESREE